MAEKTLKLPSEVYAEIKDKPLIGKRRRVQLPQWAVAWLVLLPALVFLALFMFYPIINCFFMAFIRDFQYVDSGGTFALSNFFRAFSDPCLQPFEGAIHCTKRLGKYFMAFGFNNFQTVLSNQLFLQSILNTAILVIVEVPLTIIISLLIATFLNNIKALKGLYQTIFFLPYVTNSIALGLVFSILFSNTSGGIMNYIITRLGGQPVNFLGDIAGLPYKMADGTIVELPAASKFNQGIVIVVNSVWNGLAFKILVFMAGLATIDKQYTDAARIDGAKSFTIWRRITLPLLSPQILYITITSFIGAFKMYTGVISVYGQGAYYFGGINKTDWMPVVGWIYLQMSNESQYKGINLGVPAAGSLVLLAIIMLITAVQFGVSKKRVHY